MGRISASCRVIRTSSMLQNKSLRHKSDPSVVRKGGVCRPAGGCAASSFPRAARLGSACSPWSPVPCAGDKHLVRTLGCRRRAVEGMSFWGSLAQPDGGGGGVLKAARRHFASSREVESRGLQGRALRCRECSQLRATPVSHSC